MLKIKKFIVSDFMENVYFVFDDKSKKAFVVDPGDEADKLIDFIEENKLDLKFILLTHGHVDHIRAIKPLQEKYNVPLYASENEEELLQRPDWNLSNFFVESGITIKIDKKLKDGEIISFENYVIKAISTPGHTAGSMCYLINNILISGDTLFKGSIGRTDLPTGNYQAIIDSNKEKLLTLPDDVIVLSGHGDDTTILFEKNSNPFLR